MGYQTGILDALRDWGLTVVEVPGWQTRGSPDFAPRGHVVHHDVIGPTTTCPRIIIDGRSDLAGPLSQFWLERNGRVHLVAAGRASHAGSGGWNGLYGNSSVWGTEMNNLGTPADPWPEAQIDAMVRLAACTAEFSGFTASMVPAHREWTSRKVDPHSIDMAAFRIRVREATPDPIDWGAIASLEDPDMTTALIKVRNKPGPASAIDLSTGQVTPIRSTAIFTEWAKRMPSVEVSQSVYDAQIRASVPWWKRVIRTKAA